MTTNENNMLMHSIDFTSDDLLANRAGVLSERQQLEFAGRRLRLRQMTVWLFGIPGMLLCGLLAYLLASAGTQAHPEQEPVLIIVTSALLVAAVVLVSVPTLRKLLGNSGSKRVLRVTGRAQVLALPVATPFFRPIFGSMRASGAVYRLRVGDVGFRLPAETLSLLTEGATYSIYYIHSTVGNRILSLERAAEDSQ